MAKPSDQLIDSLFQKINHVLNTDTELLITNYKKKDGGEIRVEEIKDKINDFKEFLSYLKEDALLLLDMEQVNNLRIGLNEVFESIDDFNNMEFNPNATPTQMRQPITHYFSHPNNYDAKKRELNKIVIESLTKYNTKLLEGSSHQNKLQEIEKTLVEFEKKKKTLEDIISNFQTELSLAGVSKHSSIFSRQAQIHSDKSDTWRNWSIGINYYK